MDDAFFQELDHHISNIGTDVIWKQRLYNITVWFSPISYMAQTKANETIMNEDLGASALQETKRVTLSYAIVGFDNIDLSNYKDAGPVFPVRGKDGKIVKVELSKYIHAKIAGWNSEFVDLAFSIFADLNESYKKKLAEGVKFENLKDASQELEELEQKVKELRSQLKLPPLIEAPVQEPSKSEQREILQEVREEINSGLISTPNAIPIPVEPVRPREIPREATEVPPMEPPTVNLPVPVIGNQPLSRSSTSVLEVLHQPTSSPNNAYTALPSVNQEIIESRTVREPVSQPKIDKGIAGQSVNPRFAKPNR